jgi:hypothetical protein
MIDMKQIPGLLKQEQESFPLLFSLIFDKIKFDDNYNYDIKLFKNIKE